MSQEQLEHILAQERQFGNTKANKVLLCEILQSSPVIVAKFLDLVVKKIGSLPTNKLHTQKLKTDVVNSILPAVM